MSVFGAAPQEHTSTHDVAQATEQYHTARTPPAFSAKQPLKTPPTNQGFTINQPSSTGRLRDRRQQQRTRTAPLQRSDAATRVHNGNVRGNQLQFNPISFPNNTSSLVPRQNITAGTERDGEFIWRAEQQHSRVRGRASSELRVQIPGQQTRTSICSPQHTGLTVPDPCMPIEECGERIERLLQRVQQMHREYETRQALAPPQTPTRLDEQRMKLTNARTNDIRGHTDNSTASSVATEALNDSGAPDATVRLRSEGILSPRRRAETRDVEAKVIQEGLFGTELVAKTPIERTREKLALLRARRAARLREEVDSPISESVMETSQVRAKDLVRTRSEISGTTAYPSDEDDGTDGAGFYEMRDNLALFREIDMPARDIHWDKRVFYHHVSRTNERFRHATEDVTIADCRDSCLSELTGRRPTSQESNSTGARDVLRRRSRGTFNVRQQEAGEVEALCAWMEEDDCENDEADHSFDWSRNGFGYMEFRRRSRSSVASTASLLSPAPEPHPATPPASGSLERMVSPSHASSGHTWSITSSTARAATANFNEAVSAAAAAGSPLPDEECFDFAQPGVFGMGTRTHVQRGLHQHPHSGFGETLEGIAESDEPDDDWLLLDKEDGVDPASTIDVEEAAQAQLRVLKSENYELTCNVSQSRAAIQALVRIALRTQ
ncbi:hypothetical protein H4R24_003733 [Coemansia sp. RSA 988]|nr:hypothetical protein H4R24_003733 [Coemansia sp. RSA 988]